MLLEQLHSRIFNLFHPQPKKEQIALQLYTRELSKERNLKGDQLPLLDTYGKRKAGFGARLRIPHWRIINSKGEEFVCEESIFLYANGTQVKKVAEGFICTDIHDWKHLTNITSPQNLC